LAPSRPTLLLRGETPGHASLQVLFFLVGGFEQATVLVDDDYDGTVARDGWAVYRQYRKATHQTCTAHLVRRCEEMITDGPGWARGTPRLVKDILQAALEARYLPARQRRAVATDLAERIELIAEQAHPHEANRRLVKHLATSTVTRQRRKLTSRSSAATSTGAAYFNYWDCIATVYGGPATATGSSSAELRFRSPGQAKRAPTSSGSR
jgi:Transposase IS66 family